MWVYVDGFAVKTAYMTVRSNCGLFVGGGKRLNVDLWPGISFLTGRSRGWDTLNHSIFDTASINDASEHWNFTWPPTTFPYMRLITENKIIICCKAWNVQHFSLPSQFENWLSMIAVKFSLLNTSKLVDMLKPNSHFLGYILNNTKWVHVRLYNRHTKLNWVAKQISHHGSLHNDDYVKVTDVSWNWNRVSV